ncbi:hypothetical protein DICA3_D06348 [Diutina catenulata]
MLLTGLLFGCVLILSVVGVQSRISITNNSPLLIGSVLLAVFIPLSIVVLLPVDWVSHNNDQPIPGFSMAEKAYWLLWRVAYWITFILTWLILPMLLEYYRSGQYQWHRKLQDAFRANLKFQLMMLSLGIGCGVYFMLEVGLTPSHLKDMVMGLTHIYSLVLALWLMAHSLVAIPRHRWVEGSNVLHLNSLYLRVPGLIDRIEDTKTGFRDDIFKVIMLSRNFANDFEFRDWIISLERKIPDDLRQQLEREYSGEEANFIIATLDNNYMVQLTRSFNTHYYRLMADRSEFECLLLDITQLEDVLNHDAESVEFRFHTYNPKRKWYMIKYVRPIASRISCIVLALVSLIILESELWHGTRFSAVNLISRFSSGWQLVVTCVMFSYMLFASLTSLTQLKIFNMYHLVARNSDPCSASWFAMYIARMTIPLSYNFIGLFVSRASVFEEWFGTSVRLTGLFTVLNNWLPRLLLIPILLSAFNVYDKLKRKIGWFDLGFDDFEDDDDEAARTSSRADLAIAEAKRLVNREMHRRTSSQVNSHSGLMNRMASSS